MYCPSCGKPNNTDQKFCRACGMNLEQSAHSLLEQFPNKQRLDLQREEKMLERFGKVAFMGFGIVIGIAILAMVYFIFEKMVLSGEQSLPGLLLISFIVFAGLTLGYVIWNENLKEKRAKIEATPAPAADESRPTGKLTDGADFEPVPSVTENTTAHLERPKSPPPTG